MGKRYRGSDHCMEKDLALREHNRSVRTRVLPPPSLHYIISHILRLPYYERTRTGSAEWMLLEEALQ